MNAGVKSSIWPLLAESWSWNRASTSTAPTPTSFILICWLRGTLKVSELSPWVLPTQPIVTVSPR